MKTYYEITHPLGKIRPQHFIDHFDGDSLKSYWNLFLQGTGTSGAMLDEVNGGWRGSISTDAASRFKLNLGGIRQFDPSNHMFIATMRQSSTTNTATQFATTNDATDGGQIANLSYMSAGYISSVSANWLLRTNDDTGGGTNTATSVAATTNWTTFQAISKSSYARLYIDSDFAAVRTSDLPISKMVPTYDVQNLSTNSYNADIRYCEVFNL